MALTKPSINMLDLAPMKNYIINGAFDVAQRATSAVGTSKFTWTYR